MKKKLAALDPHALAEQLFKVREELAAFDDSIKPLKEKEEALRADMLAALKENRLDTFRDDNVPLTFTRSYRKGYEITDVDTALEWATKNGCVVVDKKALPKLLEGKGAIPDGFEYKETSYLSIKTSGD